MDHILHQLGGLLLGALPTAVLFIGLVFAYRYLVYGPLLRMLAERRARTEGAVEKANAAIGAADAKSQEYEARLRAARTEIYQRREQRMQALSAERERALDSARQGAHQRVQTARTAIDHEAAEARAQIEASIEKIAAQILQAILPASVGRVGQAPGESPR
ncbi:MAG TPA: ATP synthase F0 subunit B [Acidisarcina sp.]